MKIKKIAVSVLIFFAAGFFLLPSVAEAGCCVSGSSCSDSSNQPACENGGGQYHLADCSAVSGCSISPESTGLFIPDNTNLPDPADGIAGVLVAILNWLLAILALIAVIAFVISGYQYITAMGNEDQAETAKRNMTYAAIGLAVALMGLVIVVTIDSIITGDFEFNFFF